MSLRAISRKLAHGLGLVGLALVNSCIPNQPAKVGGGINITLYGFSILKEPLEKSIYPSFSAKWKQEHGQDVTFTSSFAGSETVTNQILQGVKADVALLSIEREAVRLKQAGVVTTDWHSSPYKGIINKTPFVIVVRKGNPKRISDFADLGKRGVKLIHPDPTMSGGGQWSLLAIYGSALVKSEQETGEADYGQALKVLRAIWKNVISTPGSAREARTQFETGFGDALITYELEALLMKDANAPIEIVSPQATIFSEHPAIVIDRTASRSARHVINAFLQYLWSEQAQGAFVEHHFRAVTNEALNQANKNFTEIKMPFTVEYFGGWDKAYPDVIEGVFREQVNRAK